MEIYKSGTVIADRYEIVKMAGAGGMGVVYFAVDNRQDGLPVALKTFHPELLKDRKVRDQFLKEATVWLELGRHPHIVEAYKIERIEGRGELFIAAELISPETGRRDASLRSWIELDGIDWKKVVLFGLQIVWGMQHAVRMHPGLVHRDLKPENVLVGEDKLPGTKINRLRVTDFGLVGGLAEHEEGVLVESGSLTGLLGQRSQSLGRVAGTPAYMSVEQWFGEKLDSRSDIYAWGLIMAELLSGKTVVQGKSVQAMREAHLAGAQLSLPANVPVALAQMLEQSTARTAGSRLAGWDMLEVQLHKIWQDNAGGVFPTGIGDVKTEIVQDSERQMRAYNTIGLSYVDIGKYDVALRYYERTLHLSHELGDRIWEGRASGNIGVVYEKIGQYKQALGYHERDLAISRDFDDQLGECIALGNVGNVYLNIGQYEQALEYYKKHLAVARKLGDRAGEGRALGNIGVVYKNLGQYEQALSYYEQDLAITLILGDRAGEGSSLGNIGVVYWNIGQYEKALGHLEQALLIAQELGDRAEEGALFGNMGSVYGSISKYEKALGYYEQALVIAHELGNRASEGRVLSGLGIVYDRVGQYEQALDCYRQQLVIAHDIGDILGYAITSFNLAALLTNRGQLTQALTYARQSWEIFEKIGQPQYVLDAQVLIKEIEQAMGQQKK